MITSARFRAASKAACIHLGISALIGLATAAVVFGLWFPYPYRDLAGGQHLFLVMVGVDVVCGPLLTAVLFSPHKSRRELTLDLSLISAVQLAALVYGVHVTSQARPIALAFETDRLVAVSAAQIEPADLAQAPPGLQSLSWNGPVLVGTRQPKDGDETLKSIGMSLQGVEPSARPSWWQTYEKSRPVVKQRMKKLADLRASGSGEAQTAIDTAAAKTGLKLDALYYLPLTSQKMLDGWIAMLDPDGRIVGYAPVDGF
jgi:hypothetical protein